MKHKIYIASTLGNAERVRQIRDRLVRLDIGLTYDWTEHNGGQPYISNEDAALKREVAEKELTGVRDAEAILVVLPGGCGTHFEMSAAYCWRKPIVMLIQATNDNIPSFHYLRNIDKTTSEDEAIQMVLQYLHKHKTIETHFIDELEKK